MTQDHTLPFNRDCATAEGKYRLVAALDPTGAPALLRASASGFLAGNLTSLVTTPVMSVAGAYATGDYIGTTTTPQAFASATLSAAGLAKIKSLVITDKQTAAAVALELWLFSSSFVAPTDNAAWAITDTEALTCIGVIPIGTTKWYASSNNKVFSDDTLNLVVKPGVTSLYYALVARGTTPTWVSGDLQLTLGIEQN